MPFIYPYYALVTISNSGSLLTVYGIVKEPPVSLPTIVIVVAVSIVTVLAVIINLVPTTETEVAASSPIAENVDSCSTDPPGATLIDAIAEFESMQVYPAVLLPFAIFTVDGEIIVATPGLLCDIED